MSEIENTDSTWLFEISPKNKFFSLNLKEVWQYRDLLMLFVKRDVVTVYKQTVLGVVSHKVCKFKNIGVCANPNTFFT